MGEPVDTKGVRRYRVVLVNYGSDVDLVCIDGESRIEEADDYDVVLAKDHDRALTAAQQRIADLEAQCARVKRDAERYAWLRDQYRLMSPHMNSNHRWSPKMAAILCGPSVDAAVDAAMAANGDDWLTREARQIGLHSPACASVRFGQNECDCGAKP